CTTGEIRAEGGDVRRIRGALGSEWELRQRSYAHVLEDDGGSELQGGGPVRRGYRSALRWQHDGRACQQREQRGGTHETSQACCCNLHVGRYSQVHVEARSRMLHGRPDLL